MEEFGLQPLGIETLYKESKATFDEKAGLYLDMYGKDKLYISGKAEELELCADAFVQRDQIIFKIGYYNYNNRKNKVSIEVRFNITMKELDKTLETEMISEVVIFVVTILHAIAVLTKNSGLKQKTGSLTYGECGKIQCLYEEKIREHMVRLP